MVSEDLTDDEASTEETESDDEFSSQNVLTTNSVGSLRAKAFLDSREEPTEKGLQTHRFTTFQSFDKLCHSWMRIFLFRNRLDVDLHVTK
mmetsp:Transcript_5448/g.9999  ORF Transcript_5448/g.9999 Transcript_5448/m.9999 type:complete len:90 (+) Transcript_5448:812-1081(+)